MFDVLHIVAFIHLDKRFQAVNGRCVPYFVICRPETNLQPWDAEFSNIKHGSQALSWTERITWAYWKGNLDVGSPVRTELLQCNDSSYWGTEVIPQSWEEEKTMGFEQSKLLKQCKHRYKIYAEGYAWSVSLKYIISCGSLALIISPEYEDFFSRGLSPQENYWPISSTDLCGNIKYAVSWGNANPYERIFKQREAEPPGDIKQLFDYYSEDGIMTIDNLLRFMVEFQKEKDATKEDALAIFYSLRHLNIFQRKGLHLHAFFRYLLGDLNPPLSPSSKVHHDMSAPLSHYFMFTGHNSYLTGNQLSSDSSSTPIIKALKNNVRVIELDLWPNSGGDKVEVCHGGTLTSPVDLTKCLHATRDCAFYASDYPVVLTFEDHLTPFLQSEVAQLVTKTFGAMLHQPETDPMAEFPSPDSLKRKILISTKPPKEYLESQTGVEKENDLVQEEQLGAQNEQDEIEGNVFPEYRHLISIHAGKPKGGVESYLRVDVTRVTRLSLSEQELENISGTHGPDIVRFSQRNLLRIYPKGLRFDSSNYNPFLGWVHGAQMVAFNMQGYGKFLWIMQGMFRANGGCGYLRKPELLMSTVDIFDPRQTLPPKIILKVTVYLGEGWHLDFKKNHFDRFSPPDFYTRVGIAGVAADSVMKRTRAIEDDWIPVWNNEFEFPLTVPELAILRIEVLEYDTTGSPDFGGQTCLPVTELREGIRAVPLHNRKGERYRSVKLLMRFQFLSC